MVSTPKDELKKAPTQIAKVFAQAQELARPCGGPGAFDCERCGAEAIHEPIGPEARSKACQRPGPKPCTNPDCTRGEDETPAMHPPIWLPKRWVRADRTISFTEIGDGTLEPGSWVWPERCGACVEVTHQGALKANPELYRADAMASCGLTDSRWSRVRAKVAARTFAAPMDIVAAATLEAQHGDGDLVWWQVRHAQVAAVGMTQARIEQAIGRCEMPSVRLINASWWGSDVKASWDGSRIDKEHQAEVLRGLRRCKSLVLMLEAPKETGDRDKPAQLRAGLTRDLAELVEQRFFSGRETVIISQERLSQWRSFAPALARSFDTLTEEDQW